jgi:hypothetical protein
MVHLETSKSEYLMRTVELGKRNPGLLSNKACLTNISQWLHGFSIGAEALCLYAYGCMVDTRHKASLDIK